MATTDGQQAMTSERLMEIGQRAYAPKPISMMPLGQSLADWISAADTDRVALLAEVERQRVVLAEVGSHVQEALTDIAQSVLESGGLPPEQFPLDHARLTVVSLEQRLTQMRWLLEQKGGGDGQR